MRTNLLRMVLVLAVLFQFQGSFSEARELKQDLQQIKQARRISQFSWAQELKALRQRVLERVLSSTRSTPQSRLTA